MGEKHCAMTVDLHKIKTLSKRFSSRSEYDKGMKNL